MFSSVQCYARTISSALDIRPACIWRKALGLRAFFHSLRDFRSRCDWPIDIEAKLGDKDEAAGALGEYFWQDLWVARRVLEIAPRRLVDVGSRIDGFVAHVACHRPVEIIDRRELNSTVPGVRFHCLDIMEMPDEWRGVADCVTCLHTIEHFGLGRYGDDLDPEAWRQGLQQLASLLEPGGRLILSTPIGYERVKFNSHRIFDPGTVVAAAKESRLTLQCFAFLENSRLRSGPVVLSEAMESDMSRLSRDKYSLGVFEFIAPV